ncbi:MAG TPA: response regulator [Terriglobales bacterium]|nr:response regulator [Terriglobales bacterium]
MKTSKELILCVGRDPKGVAALRDILQGQGYQTLLARDEAAALHIFETAALDAVILDYQTAGENGVGLAERMKKINIHVPILMYSAESDYCGWELGSVDQCVSKTGSPRQLISAIKELLEVRFPPFLRWFGDWKNRFRKAGWLTLLVHPRFRQATDFRSCLLQTLNTTNARTPNVVLIHNSSVVGKKHCFSGCTSAFLRAE